MNVKKLLLQCLSLKKRDKIRIFTFASPDLKIIADANIDISLG